jgi:hypothetical protein
MPTAPKVTAFASLTLSLRALTTSPMRGSAPTRPSSNELSTLN